MAALLSRLSPANGKADGKTDGKAAAKPAAQHPHGDPSVTVTPAGQIGASIALKVLQRAVEAQKAADEQARAQAAQRDAAGLRGRAERG